MFPEKKVHYVFQVWRQKKRPSHPKIQKKKVSQLVFVCVQKKMLPSDLFFWRDKPRPTSPRQQSALRIIPDLPPQKKTLPQSRGKQAAPKKNIGIAGKRCQKQASVTVVGFRILNHGNHPNVIVGRVVHLILETQMTLVFVELLNTPTMNLSKTIFSSNIYTKCR